MTIAGILHSAPSAPNLSQEVWVPFNPGYITVKREHKFTKDHQGINSEVGLVGGFNPSQK
jgi:hypothetical protein